MATKCGNCGTEVDVDASQCPGCGATFEDTNPIAGSLPASWLGIGAGFLSVLLLSVTGAVGPLMLVGLGAGLAIVVWIFAEFVG